MFCRSFHRHVPIELSTYFSCSNSATVDRTANFSILSHSCHWVCKLKYEFRNKTENNKCRTEKIERRKQEKLKNTKTVDERKI
jgi:hypothetical protein